MAHPIRHTHLRHLPVSAPSGDGYHLYAVRFEDGLVKIGLTGNPRCRALRLQFAQQQLIAEIVIHQLPAGAHRHDEERSALLRAHAIARPISGREWFRGLPFADAVRAIEAAPKSRAPAVKAEPATTQEG